MCQGLEDQPASGVPPLDVDALVRAYRPALKNFVMRRIRNPADAEDLVQSACLEAYRSQSKFRGLSTARTWLFGIAINMIRGHVTRSPQFQHEFESDDMLQYLAAGTLDPSVVAEQRELLQLVVDASGDLHPSIAGVFNLICETECSYAEAAEILDVPIGTVRSRLSRARTHIERSLEKEPLRSNGIEEDDL
jgi:RNA polymerase sigma-70 factor (ECF subfamily)